MAIIKCTKFPFLLLTLLLPTFHCQQLQDHGLSDSPRTPEQPWSPMPDNFNPNPSPNLGNTPPQFQPGFQGPEIPPQFQGPMNPPQPSPDMDTDPELSLWSHSAVLDNDGKVVLHWTPSPDGSEIQFQVVARTKGYIGVGFSPNGLMPMSDIVVGWVSNGNPTLQDRYAEGHIEPTLDTQQDYRLISGHENETHTTLTFTRKYDTCDERDMIITNDTMYVIFAMHDDDPQGTVLVKHTFGGSKRLYLAGFDKPYKNSNNNSPGTGSWELRMPNISLPRSSGMACMKSAVTVPPPANGKAEIVGFEPVFTNGHAHHISYMKLYECDNSNPQQQTKSSASSDCSSSEDFTNCTAIVFASGPGSKGNTLPASTSYPVMGNGANFVLEVRYEQLEKFDGNPDDSGFRLFYDSGDRNRQREEVATMVVGHILGSSQIVPPTQRAFISVGTCDSECTRQYLKHDGVYIGSVFLQGGDLAEQMKLRHIRRDMELAPIATDNHYNSSAQTQRILLDPIHVLPGDQLILECTYNTQEVRTTTLGGSGSDNAACLAHLQYFPKSDLKSCASSPPLNQIFEMLGARQNTGHVPTSYDELVPNAPDPKMADYLKSYSWASGSGDYQTLVKTGSYIPVCGRISSSLYGLSFNTTMSEVKQLPKVSNPYYEHSSCGHGNNTSGHGVIFPSDPQPAPWDPNLGFHENGGQGGHDVMPNDFPGHNFGDVPVSTGTNMSHEDPTLSTTTEPSRKSGSSAHKNELKSSSATMTMASTWLTVAIILFILLRRE